MSTASLPHEHNRRVAPRKALRRPATVVHGKVTQSVRTWDLGQDGMCLLAPRPIAPGTRCKVSFDVPVGDELTPLTASAKVVYSSYSAEGDFKIGAVFMGLDDDAALVLRRFVAAS